MNTLTTRSEVYRICVFVWQGDSILNQILENQAEKPASSKAAWISIREISQLCHLGQSTIRKLIAKNYVPHMRVGRKILIPREAFFRWWETDALNLRLPSERR
jgi:excisionase family DNA binding protein